MKKRLSALDGLRGWAALAVLFSHSGFTIESVIKIPFLTFLYKTFAVGPNSVQILFVLSGFLIAYLYPTIQNPIQFIKKRYARILPVYIVIVLFISLFFSRGAFWGNEVSQLVILALLPFILWTIFEKLKISERIGSILFYSYLVLQALFLFINLFVTPRFIQFGIIHLPEVYKNILIIFSNITFTTPFVSGVPRLSGVFWSLAPEIYFYLIYPFFVIPLIHIGKKLGAFATVVISFSIIKILFDLDGEFVGQGSLLSLSIARSCGFVTGVLAGSIYESKGYLWKKIELMGRSPIAQFCCLLAFFAIQWGDWAIRDGQSIYFMNAYYLVASFVFALVILMSIIPHSLNNRIFGSKFLVFFGVISYSMYLIHTQTVHWISQMTYISSRSIFFPIMVLLFTTIISLILFKFVESLYFRSKKKSSLPSENTTKKKSSIILISIAAISLCIFIYSGGYSPSFLLSRHSIVKNFSFQFEKSLLNNSIKIPFTSKFNNLSAVVIDLRYGKSAGETLDTIKKPAILFFRLYDSHTGKKLFESQRNAYDIEGTPRYPFGITTIPNSMGKNYIVELTLENGKDNDQVYINTLPTSMVSIYTTSKKELFAHPLSFIINRLGFIFSHQGMIFALFFIVFSVYFYERTNR